MRLNQSYIESRSRITAAAAEARGACIPHTAAPRGQCVEVPVAPGRNRIVVIVVVVVVFGAARVRGRVRAASLGFPPRPAEERRCGGTL